MVRRKYTFDNFKSKKFVNNTPTIFEEYTKKIGKNLLWSAKFYFFGMVIIFIVKVLIIAYCLFFR